MKNKKVCKGCKYLLKSSISILDGTCDYLEQTGRSRMLIEKQNGGPKQDSCICYEAGRRKRKNRKLNMKAGEQNGKEQQTDKSI